MYFRGIVSKSVTHSYTLFLFTKSDIKTIVIPVTLFAVAASPRLNCSQIHHVVFWIWVHVLQFGISNQILSPEEDALNKRDRPLPSNRISMEAAHRLWWITVAVCWILSSRYSAGTFGASVALIALTVLYNNFGAHHNLVSKNVVNAAGFAAFELGATLVATKGHQGLDWAARLSVYLSTGIIATTIHTQDFKDIHGDRLIGRLTIPIVLPKLARCTVLIGVFIWSIGLSYIWAVGFGTAFVFVVLGIFVGCRFLTLTSVHDDQISFYWYNVWLSLAHALPVYYRVFGATH